MKLKFTYREGAEVVIDDEALVSCERLDDARLSTGQVNLDASIEALGFSTRATNVLRREGIRTLRQLLGYTLHELSLVRGMGLTTLMNLQHGLARLGLLLGSSLGERGERSGYREQLDLLSMPELNGAGTVHTEPET